MYHQKRTRYRCLTAITWTSGLISRQVPLPHMEKRMSLVITRLTAPTLKIELCRIYVTALKLPGPFIMGSCYNLISHSQPHPPLLYAEGGAGYTRLVITKVDCTCQS